MEGGKEERGEGCMEGGKEERGEGWMDGGREGGREGGEGEGGYWLWGSREVVSRLLLQLLSDLIAKEGDGIEWCEHDERRQHTLVETSETL